jgi:NitT/TauT family transport system substrate-binding protein
MVWFLRIFFGLPHLREVANTMTIARRKLAGALALGLSALLLTPTLAVPPAQAELMKASVRLKWLAQAQFAGFYVGLAKGYYREAGIDLTINPGGPNLVAENLVAGGSDQFGQAGGTESLLASRDKALPVVGLAVMHQRTPFGFVVKGASPIKKFEDVRGHKASAWFTGAQFVLYGMLAARGVPQSEVTILPQQVSMTPFIKGDVDMVAVTYYNELLVLREQGVTDVRLFAPEDYGITIPRDVLITSEKVIAEQPALVQGFLTATFRGWKEAFQHPAEAIDILLKAAPGLERPHQEGMLDEIRKLMVAGKASTEGMGVTDPQVLAFVDKFLLDAKVLNAPVDLSKAIDTSFWTKVPLADKKL